MPQRGLWLPAGAGGIPREGIQARQMTPHICNTSSCVSIGRLQTNSNEQTLSSPPPAHTPLQCYTHTSVCLTVQVLTGQREIISETPLIEAHPSFCTDISAPGKLQLGCSTQLQALPTVASGQEQQHCSEPSQCRSFSRPCFGSNSC